MNRRAAKSATEVDAFSRWGRKHLTYIQRTGVRSKIKRQARRRERREGRDESREAERYDDLSNGVLNNRTTRRNGEQFALIVTIPDRPFRRT